MADQRKRLSELPTSKDTKGLYTLGVNENNEGVKIPIGELIEGVKTPASNAEKAANEAKTAAANATSTANAAKSAADAATQAANAAKTAADTATKTANEAKTASNDAKTAASNAQSAANSAAQSAQNAVTAVDEKVAPRLFINVSKLFNNFDPLTLSAAVALLNSHKDIAMFNAQGTVITFKTADSWESWQFVKPGAFTITDNWRKFGGSATVGNTYNVTVDEPLSMGYYTLETAIAKAFEKGYNNVGLQITFAIAAKTWKMYQFIGADNGRTAFTNPNNWIDLAGTSAGAETLINIDALCGTCQNADFYTLEYAIAALQKLQTETGITYAKPGLVITYQSGENTFETRQFNSTVGNFGEAGLWKPFGEGGGSKVETKDEPEEDGKDAFSTGGAFKLMPTAINIDTETEGVVKVALENEAGEIIGEQKQFAVGTGTGGGSAIIMEITPKESPLYGQAGGTIQFRCAITLKNGTEYESGIVERVELYDRDTNALLDTFKPNQRTSDDKDSTDDFVFDISSYFTLASSRRFKFVAYDDSDHTASRNVNVTAVDVTIKSEQTLNYTSSTVITEGANKSFMLPMYRFPNNASDKGILCTVEIFIEGAWRELGTANVNDTYAHSISINPANCCGKALKHGAYPLRIHGVDVSSGVVGNYLHTAVMVVNTDSTTPIVVSRWYTEHESGEIKQYESINIDFAAYAPNVSTVDVNVVETISGTRTIKQTTGCVRNSFYTYTQRVQNIATDGSKTIGITFESVQNPAVKTESADFRVNGSLLNIESVSAQLLYDIDFAGRSNDDTDRTIKDGGYELTLHGANYSTNGFVKDSFGTEDYDTDNDPGVMALRIAENVTGELNHAPFNVAGIETNGMAIQFRIRAKHIADDNARLISCISNGIGFYVTGQNVVFTTDNGATVQHTITAAVEENSLIDVAIVIEPTSVSPYGGIGVAKMYFDGELVGACYYETGSLSRHNTPITFNGSSGDLYLYNIRAWETYYTFEQSFNNYLLKLINSETMITEYNFNQVMASQAAEGKPARNIPQMAALLERGIPCVVICKSKSTENTPDNYPDYLEGLDGDKKTSRVYDWYIYHPQRWRSVIIEDDPTTNQGTTSSMRPIKNKKCKMKKARVRMMYDRSEFTDAAQLAEYDFLAGLAAKNYVQITPGSMPTNILCIKVDYSESGGANNGGSTNLYNDLTRALGSNYMTPAQNAYTGEYELNPCITSIPCALFRTDTNSPDATSPSYGYFHAKGNLNHDKGDAGVFGFENVPGYNQGCLNYGDFVELIAARNQSLDAFAQSVDKSSWDTGNVYVLSEFCGNGHKVFRHQSGSWVETTGKMEYSGGRWRITGDVVNPVDNYELKAYNALDWFQGVKTVDDMLQPDESGTPIWLTYFESRYPDNDDLNQAYEDGRKVPYNLFKWLEWCEQCNQHNTAADGNITIDGASVSGTPENRLKKFKRELHQVANVYSMLCYHVFTDYIAAVDQRSKNMMIGFYPDTDGVTRMYLNHLYDGDTIWGSDNDCGLTIPVELDPNNDPNGYYQGHDSVLFTQIAKSDFIWLTKYTADTDTADTTKTITVAAVAKAMRECELRSTGLRPFSPMGIEKDFITDRLAKWAKLVSSYDGIRKYIDASKSSANYFYALHGLSIQRLRDYVETRMRFRDGFYQCGDTFASAVRMRCTGTNMSVKITAAKDGYFGIGVDRANEARESVYLKAGQSATLHSNNTNTGSGVMLYIFGADRIGELDITNATPKANGWDISELTLLKKLIIGGASYRPATNNGDELTTLNLGQLPFLEELDVRNFPIVSINAEYCPRLKTVLATGSKLQTFVPAQTAPISTLTLPDTMTTLSFVDLPNLVYPNGGLTIAGFRNVTRLQVSGCPKIEPVTMLMNVVNGGAKLAEIGIYDVDVVADVSILNGLMSSGVKGIGSDAPTGCDGLTGRWVLTTLIEDDALATLKRYFKPNDVGLDLHNAQFTGVVFDDLVSDPSKKVTNLENGTNGEKYEPTGHILRIRAGLIPVKGKLQGGKWVGERLSNANYRQLFNGNDFDYSDSLGDGFDSMMRCPKFWYKGVNDFKNQKKYLYWSSVENEPISTAKKITRKKLSEIQYAANKSLYTADIAKNVTNIDDENVLQTTPNFNTYRIDVEGMKQVRYPGMNNSSIGAAFTDESGVIIDTFNMAISAPLFDFVDGEYIFINVPANAKYFYFTSQNTNSDVEAIAVDSDNIEAIEPDWVHNDEWLAGIYQASVDGMGNLRSISNATTRVGTGTQTTSAEWQYDNDGKPRNTPVNAMNYTVKDFQNLAMRKGAGFQLIDYEMSKLMALLWYSMTGQIDAQLICGYGKGSGGTTGYMDTIGNADSVRATSNNGNKCLGFESFFGCTTEYMDNVAVNVVSWESYLKNKGVEITQDPVDAKWHIYDPITKTERVVQGITPNGVCIARTKHGRYADVIASKCSGDSTSWASDYCDANYYTASRCRVVFRSSYNAYAYGGLVFAFANVASSVSVSYYGSRLAFRGVIEIKE